MTPLAQCTMGLVTTAGLRLSGQPLFDTRNSMGGSSFREFPGDLSTGVGKVPLISKQVI